MTTDYGCALGDPGHKVNWLITRLQPALTISLCDEDLPVGLIPLLGSELGVDPARLYDMVKRFVDREQARQAKVDTALQERLAIVREQHGDLCPECGVRWEDPSPDCPHEINNLHPLTAKAGP